MREPGYFAHDDNKVERFDDDYLCQSAADPEDRMHDLDPRTAPRENRHCSRPFLIFSLLGPRIVQNCHGLTEARTNLGSQDIQNCHGLAEARTNLGSQDIQSCGCKAPKKRAPTRRAPLFVILSGLELTGGR